MSILKRWFLMTFYRCRCKYTFGNGKHHECGRWYFSKGKP